MNVKGLSTPEVQRLMREALQPKGTAPVVCLGFLCSTTTNTAYYDVAFVHKCIDEITNLQMRRIMGEEPNPLEQLAIQLLLSSAYLDAR